MGTGIVSIALALDGEEALSRILLVAAALAWLALGALLAGRVLRDRERVRADARSPAALTGVAASAVLGTRLLGLGWNGAAIALLALALLLWLVLLGPVLAHLAVPTVGASLILTVSTESLAELAAAIAQDERARWLLDAALAPLVLGLVLDAWVIRRFDLRQLAIGRGDHWITGGALAISTLAAARVTLAADALGSLASLRGALEALTLALWVVTIAWLPVLVAAELVRPRPGYDMRRWSTVFPVGMHAACSFAAGDAAHAPGITEFARVWVWTGVAVWLAVTVAMLRRGLVLLRAAPGAAPAPGAARSGQR